MKNNNYAAFFIFIIYSIFILMPIHSQDLTPNRTPEPYGIDEFNTWQKDLRRFEIISLGALPFVTFLSFWSYDIIRSVKHMGNSAYAPWPLKNPETAIPLTQTEQKNILFTSIGISIGIAIIDLSVRLIKRDINKRKKKALELSEPQPIKLIPIEDGGIYPGIKKEASQNEEKKTKNLEKQNTGE